MGPDLFLPPQGPCSSSTQRKRARCHLSTNGVAWEAQLSLAEKKACTDFLAYLHYTTQHNRRLEDTPSQLSSDAGSIPRARGQDVGLEDKSHFSMHMSAASVHFGSALTFVIQRPFIHKQRWELRCCRITGSVRPRPQTSQPTFALTPAGMFCQTTAEPARPRVKMLKGGAQRGDL